MNLAADLDEALRDNLQPEHMLRDVCGPEERFLARYGDTQLLLVKLAPGFDALEIGLNHSDRVTVTRVQPSIRVLGFETQVITEEQLVGLEAGDFSEGLVRKDRLRWLLRNDRYFVLPLRKRTDDATFLDRISVGRATNKDMVLRHPSVSKFHAWFEMGDVGSLFVADAESTNTTLLNGKKLPARELTRVNPGDHLRFGSVECVACEPGEFWQLVHGIAG